MKVKLWSRDFTILTFGSMISMIGNSISGFAISLLVLDYSGSTFLYVLFMVVYHVPQIVMPLIAGPYLDKYSRKKAIYTLDFFSAALYLALFFVVYNNFFNYGLLMVMSLVIGTIDSVYIVAYDSFYPTLVSKGNFTKAYSVASLLWPISAVMTPVAAILYKHIGLAPLFAFNAVTFFIAAVFETQIRAVEGIVSEVKARFSFKKYREDFKEGLTYIKGEKGLLVVTAYFAVNNFTGAALGALMLPYFKANGKLGILGMTSIVTYTIVAGGMVVGRLIGGMVHYKFKYPMQKKFAIALFVYFAYTFIDGLTLYMPVWLMIAAGFAGGLLGVTSYNIRISATQSYVQDDKRARFNGTFYMLCTMGSILGQLIAGAAAEGIPTRLVVLLFNAANLFAVIFIMYRGREHVKPIYNREC